MWVVFLLMVNAPALQGRNTTCSIPAVEEGSVANLTCHFPSDISDSQYGLNVLFYKDSNPNNPITVVYSVLTNGKLDFFIHPGFSFDENISNQVNILILKASKEKVGKYVCHSDPSFTVKSCIFTLKVPSKSGASARAASSISTITTPILNEKEFRQSENLNNVVIPLMVFLACMVTLVFILLIVAAIICPKRFKGYISKDSESKDTSVEEMLPDQISN